MANRKKRGSDQEQDALEKEIELLKGGGWGEKLSSWLRENFVSLVLPIIAIVVLVAGILFASGGNITGPQTAEPVTDEGQPAVQENGIGGPETEEKSPADQAGPDQTDQQATEPADQDGQVQQPSQVQESYTLKAQAGEGITHLARRALAQYRQDLGEKAPELSPEHLVYAEDFVQNATGEFGLQLGQELTFSSNLLQKAIDASLQLSPEQLNNLQQFSQLVPSLS